MSASTGESSVTWIKHRLLAEEMKRRASTLAEPERSRVLQEFKSREDNPSLMEEWLATAEGAALLSDGGAPPTARQPADSAEDVCAVMLRDKAYSEAIVARISKEVEDRMRTRSARLEKIFFVSLAVASLAGFAGIHTIVTNAADGAAEKTINAHPKIVGLEPTIRDEARTIVNERISEVQQKLDDAELFQQLRSIALAMKLEDSFSHDLKNAAMSVVEMIAKRDGLVQQGDFPVLMRDIVAAFIAADTTEGIRAFSASVGDRLARDKVLSRQLFHAYAQMLVTASEPPDQWDPKDVEALRLYGDAAIAANYPEDVLPWRIMLELRRSGGQPTTLSDNLIEEIRAFDPGEIASAIGHIYYHRHPINWAVNPDRPTVKHLRVGEACEWLVSHYENDFREWVKQDDVADALKGEIASATRRARERGRDAIMVRELSALLTP